MFTATNFFLAAIIHGVLEIAVLLGVKRGNKTANRLLAVLIGLVTMSLWNLVVYRLELPGYLRTIDYFNWITPFLWGPVLYLYVGVASGQIQLQSKTVARHFSLGVALFGIDAFLHLISDSDASAVARDRFNEFRLLAFYIQLGIYLFASFQLLRSYEETIKQNYSDISRLTLQWLQRMVCVFAVILIVDMCLIVPAVLREEKIPYLSAIMIAEAVAVFLIGYFSLYHSGVLMRGIADDPKPKYHGSPLDPELSQALMRQLQDVMRQSEPFTNNELRLADLAGLVDVSPHYLSQVINEQAATNFYDFVNSYRVERAAQLLLDKQQNNIIDIAFTAGFNNRASFNNAFKKHLGMTPSQYRKHRNHTAPAE